MSRPWAVTGAAGFLGSHVVEQLIRRGKGVLAIDDLSVGRGEYLTPFRAANSFRLLRQDVRDRAALTAAFREYAPTAVIHLAALHFIPAAVADPAAAISLNVHGTQCVLTACRDAAVERLWFASTGDVYPPSESPHREDDRPGPFNVYGLSKLMGEQLIALEARQRPEARFVVGRLFNLYGPRETNPHILPEIVKQLRERPGEALRLGNVWPKRDLVPVADAARAVIEMLERAPAGVTTCNVASGEAASMAEVVGLIGELLGRPLPIHNDPSRVRPVERTHLQADVSRLRELLGWAPHADVRRGLAELLAAEGLLR
jgi:UDP-glucose 4-epimerase